jgi:chromosome segregation ATPase
MAASVSSSVAALSSLQEAATSIAGQLSRHLDQISSVWEQYEQRFKGVDEDLGRAAERFHHEVERHQAAIASFVAKIDEHTAAILAKLNTHVSSLDESVGTLAEALDDFRTSFNRVQAAE